MQNISILKEKETIKRNLVLDVDIVFFFFFLNLIPCITIAKNINSMDL